MAEIRVIFNDEKEIIADSYMNSKFSEDLILKFFNPDSPDEIIDTIEKCDQSKFSLLAKYPNREKKIDFVNYYIKLTNIINVDEGCILEIYFSKI